jgi:aryl sulfotransferase
MKTDLAGEMRRVAEFLGIDIPARQWPKVVERCTFEGMRKAGNGIGEYANFFDGGIEGFLFKGTDGRWRDVLDADDLAAYQRKVAATLPPEAARWIEHGRHTT